VPLSSDCAPGSTRALLMMRPAVCKSRALGCRAGASAERRRSSALVCSAGADRERPSASPKQTAVAITA
jgi:hypothetical protein